MGWYLQKCQLSSDPEAEARRRFALLWTVRPITSDSKRITLHSGIKGIFSLYISLSSHRNLYFYRHHRLSYPLTSLLYFHRRHRLYRLRTPHGIAAWYHTFSAGRRWNFISIQPMRRINSQNEFVIIEIPIAPIQYIDVDTTSVIQWSGWLRVTVMLFFRKIRPHQIKLHHLMDMAIGSFGFMLYDNRGSR